MDYRAARRVARSVLVLLVVYGSAAGCGDAGLICASSTNPGGSLVGCTGNPDDDGLSVVVVGQDAPSPR